MGHPDFSSASIRQLHGHNATASVFAIGKLNGPTVSFSNLLRENQSDARTALLRCVERHKCITGIQQADAVVLHHQQDAPIVLVSAKHNLRLAALRGLSLFQRGIYCIANQVDEHLLDQVGIDHQRNIRARLDAHG